VNAKSLSPLARLMDEALHFQLLKPTLIQRDTAWLVGEHKEQLFITVFIKIRDEGGTNTASFRYAARVVHWSSKHELLNFKIS
jgi:hypothetical protein